MSTPFEFANRVDDATSATTLRERQVSDRARPSDNGQSGSSFAERLSPLIAQGGRKRGVIPVPGLLVHFQGRLGVTDGELVYLLHVLDEKRDSQWPWVAVSQIGEGMHRDERNVRSRKESLEKKGYLVCRPRWKSDGSRGSDEHDLSGLYAELERLAIELVTNESVEQTVTDLPEPAYYHAHMQLAATPPDRLGLRIRRRQRSSDAENDHPASTSSNRGGGGEIAPTPRRNCPHPAGDFAPTRPAKSPGPEEVRLQRSSLTPQPPTGARGGGENEDQNIALKPDDTFQIALPQLAAVGLPAPGHTAQSSSDQDHGAAADELLAAFYRGLGADADQLTASHRRRELTRARELIEVCATPAEAEAYARQASATPGRLAPLDLRWFERERPAWLAKWHRPRAAVTRSSYEHDPWQGRRPPISEEDLARGMAL